MMPRFSVSIVMIAVVAWSGQKVRADTLDEVEKRLIAASKKIASLSGKVSVKMEMTQGGLEVKSEGSGTLEFAQKSGKQYFRMELSSKVRSNMGGQEMNMDQTTLTVGDGEYVYAYQEQMGQKTCLKTDADGADQNPDPESTFKSLHKSFDLKLLDDGEVSGAKVYVIEGTPKEPSQMPGGKTVFSFSKKTGFMLKTVTNGPDNKPMMTMTITDIKANQPISPARFKFEVPDGVQVIDRTKKP